MRALAEGAPPGGVSAGPGSAVVPSDGFEAFERHVNPALARFLRLSGRDFRFVHAQDGELRASDGGVFSDWVSGFGVLSFGHYPEFAVAALRRGLEERSPLHYPEALNPFAGKLAQALVLAAGEPFETCFFANGGSEAVEAALKTALAATGRSKILYASGGYHGSTLGALNCMAEGLYRQPFEGMLTPAFESVPVGDATALAERLAREDVAAFLLEPMQMEAGARVLTREYLASARQHCSAHGTLLVFDEIQTGLGRTGELFAFQHSAVRPDILTLGKALGAGLVPISAALFGAGLWQRAFGSALRCEIHSSSMGGNRLACQVGLAVLEHVQAPGFLQDIRQRSQELARGLAALHEAHRCVQRVSLLGLLGGVQLRNAAHPWATWAGLGMPELEPRPSLTALLVQRLTKQGIWAQICGHDWSVLRVQPPLTLGSQACEAFLAALDQSLTWLEENVFDG